MFGLAVGQIIGDGTQQVVLAGKSTLNRLEYCPETGTNREESRYHRIGHNTAAIEKLFVEWFLESYTKPPKTIVLEVLPCVLYRSLNYQTEKSWNRYRRVVSKVEYSHTGVNVRFVVTSIPTDKVPPGELYTHKYCPRGEMENRFKEQQLELFSDRTSTHTFEGNQLRLWFSSVAYVLMNALRSRCLATTELRAAQVGTIRTKLLKLGARLLVSVRRVLVSISSGCPYQDIFATAYRCLQTLPHPG